MRWLRGLTRHCRIKLLVHILDQSVVQRQCLQIQDVSAGHYIRFEGMACLNNSRIFLGTLFEFIKRHCTQTIRLVIMLGKVCECVRW